MLGTQIRTRLELAVGNQPAKWRTPPRRILPDPPSSHRSHESLYRALFIGFLFRATSKCSSGESQLGKRSCSNEPGGSPGQTTACQSYARSKAIPGAEHGYQPCEAPRAWIG